MDLKTLASPATSRLQTTPIFNPHVEDCVTLVLSPFKKNPEHSEYKTAATFSKPNFLKYCLIS